MKRFALSLATLLSLTMPASAQNAAADYLRQAEAVDRALGPFAELVPPTRGADAATPPLDVPAWYWRQPYDQQPFFATRPLPPGACFRRVGVMLVPC